MISEDQFRKLIEIIDLRDMIIRIDENTKNFSVQFEKHLLDDAGEQALTKNSLGKLHARVDSVEMEMVKSKSFVAGVVSIATLVISAVVVGVNIYSKVAQ